MKSRLAAFTLSNPGGLVLADPSGPLVDDTAATWCERWVQRPTALAGALPFDPAQPARLFEPRRLERLTPLTPQPRLRQTREPPPIPESPAYIEAVRAALSAIDSGTLDKVVLARSFSVPRDGLEAPALFEAFCRQNPSASNHALRLDEDRWLVGASPELLICKRGRSIRSLPLAGSLPRSGDAEADGRRARALAASAKDRSEHAWVVEHIAERLRPFCRQLRVPSSPRVIQTSSMLHLATTIEGELERPASSLELTLAIHPTPAVCGSPAPAAHALIQSLEPEPRGFYAGALGYMDAQGDGAWYLALRNAELQGSQVLLRAGAGIVADSDPRLEHEETAAKMRTAARAVFAPER